MLGWATRRAVEWLNGSTYTQLVYTPTGGKLAFMNGSTLQKYMVPLVAGLQAVYNSSGLQYYRHADWLGSVRFAAKLDGTVYGDQAYAPFGESYAVSGNGLYDFTGQTKDTVGVAYDFLFRQYSQVQSRWQVPDPAGLAAVDLTNPQTWNRYAYVGNNPLSFVDPLGLLIGLPPCDPSDPRSYCYDGSGGPPSSGYGGGENCPVTVDGLCQTGFTISTTVVDGFRFGKFKLKNPFTPPKKGWANTARCAAQFSNDHSLAAGLDAITGGAVSQNNLLVNAFLGSDSATISNLITGPDRLQNLTPVTISQGGVMAGKVVGNLPNPVATGFASLGTATVSETPAGTAFASGWTDATVATSLFGRGFGKAFFAFSVAKGIYDVSTYAFGYVVCY